MVDDQEYPRVASLATLAMKLLKQSTTLFVWGGPHPLTDLDGGAAYSGLALVIVFVLIFIIFNFLFLRTVEPRKV